MENWVHSIAPDSLLYRERRNFIMNKKENLKAVVRYWVDKAIDSLASSENELESGRFSFAVNRIYYACFYAASAVLLQKRLRFQKHSGVRAAFHQHIIKPGIISKEYGKFYDEIFEARQRGDYVELVRFEKEQIEGWLKKGRLFVETMKSLVSKEVEK
jgi:uncharacterized protein (UPF0332 family)